MIPPLIHFCFGLKPDFGGKPFSLVHYLAVRSAVEVNQPDAVYLHVRHRPSGPWWERATELAEVVDLELTDEIEEIEEIAGMPVAHHAHLADWVRLQVLAEHGGIYLDADVFCLRPFAPLLDHPAVMGQEGGADGQSEGWGLCNAVVLAEPGAFFVERWLEGFDPATSLWHGFRSRGADEHWGEMAVRYPAMLAERYPEHVHVVGPKAFFWPTWTPRDLRLLFERGDTSFDDAYCLHLWEQASWERYLADLTPDTLHAVDSSFYRLARAYV